MMEQTELDSQIDDGTELDSQIDDGTNRAR